ncbi:MAG: hypothetical protein KDA21_01010 [Phycisphaerales bacterium]|nr:hypothetical protein [Phycisphaerales bacterium]
MSLTRRRQPLRGRTRLDATLHWRFLVAMAMNVPTLLRYGDHDPLAPVQVLHGFHVGLLALYGVLLVFAYIRREWGDDHRSATARILTRVSRPEMLFVLAGLTFSFSEGVVAMVGLVLTLIYVLRGYLLLVQSSLIPSGLVFIGSFVIFVGVGTGLLMLPSATPHGQPIGFVDSVFTITSAISQTGLVVRSTGDGFTRFGQIIILIWIQVGALGVVVFGALLAEVIGTGFGLKATQTIAEGTEQGWAGQLSLQKLVIFTIVLTHGVEFIGAVILYVGWPETWLGEPGDFGTARDRFYHCIFFSVSAFCNAGFATTANSMEGLRTHWTTHTVLIPLIVFGSIGFPVLANIREVVMGRLRRRHVDGDRRLIRLNLNSRIILATWVVLYVFGFLLIFLGEVTQADQPGALALLDAHFMNLNRTSGFDTLPPHEMGVLSRLALIFLMFCGGAPGSVAGGIKLMVLAVMILTVWSTLVGRAQTEVFGRTLPDILVRKCATLIVLVLAVIMGCSAVVAYHEQHIGLEAIIFEVTSAVGTTGLSMGITADLSTPSRWAIIVAMFLGRVGPFAVFAALVSITRAGRAQYAYPTESVVVY